ERIVPYLQRAALVSDPPTPRQSEILTAAVPLVQERMETLGQAVGMLGFLLVDPADFGIDPDQSVADDDSQRVIAAATDTLSGLSDWAAEPIEQALRSALIDGLGLKPKVAFGAVRIAVTGRRVSPPLFESMEILGRDETMRRLGAAALAS
ncbi:MAG: glutamate--tRNA ligase, partial [Candidatus Nanopelagicales bacterium]